MKKKPQIALQQKFNVAIAEEILKIVYGSAYTDNYSKVHIVIEHRYNWVCIRVKKNRKSMNFSNTVLALGINSHYSNPPIFGQTTMAELKEKFHTVGFNIWKFFDDTTKDNPITLTQLAECEQYLATVGIIKPTIEEFWEYYYGHD